MIYRVIWVIYIDKCGCKVQVSCSGDDDVDKNSSNNTSEIEAEDDEVKTSEEKQPMEDPTAD